MYWLHESYVMQVWLHCPWLPSMWLRMQLPISKVIFIIFSLIQLTFMQFKNNFGKDLPNSTRSANNFFVFHRLMENMRVMGDEICYRAKECKYLNSIAEYTHFLLVTYPLSLEYQVSDLTIHKLFATRADLYRTVYTHAKVKVPAMIMSSFAVYIVCFMSYGTFSLYQSHW